MNTKGIKFLAVLAVMVMAFAAIVALAPADRDANALIVFGDDSEVQGVNPTVLDGAEGKYYISEDITVKIKDLTGPVEFYVQNGAELELDFKQRSADPLDPSDYPSVEEQITIYTVTADQQRPTTSTVDLGLAGGEDGPVEGKIIINSTMFTFEGADKQNVVYKAAVLWAVETNTTTGGYKTDVTSGDYAYVSASDVLYEADSGFMVAVAPGQSIECVDETMDSLVYGVAVKSVNDDSDIDGDFIYTYYAVGMNAGTISIKADESVTIKNGTVSVINGSASVKATSAKASTGKTVVIAYSGADQNTVSGSLASGTMSVSGKVEFVATFENKATVTLNSSADVISGSAMKVTGTLVLKNEYSKATNLKVSGTGFIVAENEKLWTYDDENKPTLKFEGGDSTFYGQYDVTAISKKADVEDAFASAKIEKNQVFRMVGDTVIADVLTIEGTLYIEPGVTMTISQLNNKGASVTVQGQYAQIINDGTIIIKTTTPLNTGSEESPEYKAIGLHVFGGTVINNGTINASSLVGADTFETLEVGYAAENPLGYGFVNNGSMIIGKYDTANLDEKFTNSKGATVSVTGSLIADSLVNKGSFTINNATIATSGTVSEFTVTMSKGAEFKVISANMATDTTMTIQNASGANSVSIATTGVTTTSDKPIRVSGITVTDTTITDVIKQLDVSGILSTTGDGVTFATKGNIDVYDSFSVSKGYKLDFSEATDLYVSGTATISKDVVLAAENNSYKLRMFVDGLVTDIDGILEDVSDFKYVAAKYTLTNGATTIYTTLGDAIPAAAEAGINQIFVGDDIDNGYFVTVYDDLVIPEGMNVDGDYLEVDGEAEILVESGAMFTFTKIVIENGMIAAADVNSINYEGVIADVMEQDEESTAAVCMSLEVALKYATEGDVITLANPFFTADADLVIPAGVVVDATAVDGTNFVMVNSDLTVNGTLLVDQFAFIATTDDTIGITVNGFIYDKCTDGHCFVPWWYNPFGVSYLFTDDEDQTWFVLTTIENIQPAINVADDAEVTVHGDAKLDELTVSGRDDLPGIVNFTGDVDIGVINIDEVTLVFADDTKITTTVKNAVGSITITGAYVDDYLSIYDMAIYSTEDVGVYMEGVVNDDETGTYSIRFDGITGMDGTETKTAINYDNYPYDTPTILFAGETTVIGKKAKINADDENYGGMVTITGTLYVDHASKLAINSDVQVLGALVAAERTEESDLGTINTNGNIFIGMLASDIYDMDYYPYAPLLSSTAIFTGKISLTEGFFIYVSPEALVDPSIVEDLDTMNLYVQDDLWFTVYGYASDVFTLEGLAVPMENARIAYVLDGFLEEVDCDVEEDTVNVIEMSYLNATTLSGYGNAIYIVLNYDIFEVKIKTDGSVKAVYIDGILMETGFSENIFLMKKVAAGIHEVTVEAATGYDANKCVIKTEMGTILPGMGFSFGETDCTEFDDGMPVVVYNLYGTEIQPEPVPPTPEEESQWTITTILLVILVVLIAIMAVIVALRLNRS